MTNETKHTPTPWVAVSNNSYWQIDPLNRKEDDPYTIGNVCASYPGDKDQGLQEANAAHIVKCVNMHDELVEALRDLLTFVVTVEYEESPIVAFAEAVLAKARGETL